MEFHTIRRWLLPQLLVIGVVFLHEDSFHSSSLCCSFSCCSMFTIGAEAAFPLDI